MSYRIEVYFGRRHRVGEMHHRETRLAVGKAAEESNLNTGWVWEEDYCDLSSYELDFRAIELANRINKITGVVAKVIDLDTNEPAKIGLITIASQKPHQG